MRILSGSKRSVLSVCVTLVMVASCGRQTGSLVPTQGGAQFTAGSHDGAQLSTSGVRDLIYAVDAGDGSVSVYSYPEGRPQTALRDVRASGLCSDRDGNLFVLQASEIRKYAHGALRPMAVLRSPLRDASQSCAVDPVTGNLAVSGGASPRFSVAIYTGAAGNPRLYSGGDLVGDHWSCTYDNEGNLFVGGATLLELPRGAQRFRGIAWSGSRMARFGAVQWDGEYLAAVTRQGAHAAMLRRYAIDSAGATFVGQSLLAGAAAPAQFSIDAEDLLVPGTSGILHYSYPGGGAPTTIGTMGLTSAVTVSRASSSKIAVITYHYDNLRTGWNDNETTLTYKSVKSGSFGLLESVTLDDQVDAQPLVVPDVTIKHGKTSGEHDVVYVATESNTIYAIDASSGQILLHRSLGKPVPTPLGCNNNGPNVGITATPVIDPTAGVMYVIAYTLEGGVPTYRLHALHLGSLKDVLPSVVVSASHPLTDGTTFTFDAKYQRQRPALLEANGVIYAGFGSFCDFAVSRSRGWLLGWQAESLTPLSANQLNDALATSPNNFFLSSIWMSGYGPAADSSGNVFFVTGNSDPSGTTYNGVTNIQESVVKISPDLTTLLSIFTPSDQARLDKGDVDFGAGGVLLLPPLEGSTPPLAAAAGKDGAMYLMDQDSLGGYNPSGPNNVLDTKTIGGCWCGQSYFGAAKDGMPRIIASGGNQVTVWAVVTSPTVKLTLAGTSPSLPGGQDPGFFTTVSSAGTKPKAIIWALARPQYVPGTMTLFAFRMEGHRPITTLYQAPAGEWASAGGNANLVPVVANGKVYVASYEQLDIFGLGGTTPKASTPRPVRVAQTPRGAPDQLTGTLIATNGSLLALRTRTGKLVRVDDAVAVRQERSVDLVIGESFTAMGTYGADRVLRAIVIVRAKPSPAMWPPDRG